MVMFFLALHDNQELYQMMTDMYSVSMGQLDVHEYSIVFTGSSWKLTEDFILVVKDSKRGHLFALKIYLDMGQKNLDITILLPRTQNYTCVLIANMESKRGILITLM